MPEDLFDVYVTGASDKTPSGQMRIAATVAARYRVPAPAIAEALEGGHYRIATRLTAPQADELVGALATLGAIGRLSQAGVALGEGLVLPDDSIALARRDLHEVFKTPDAHPAPRVVNMAEQVELTQSVRCPIHGLFYDRRQASGCMRCLAPARAQAPSMEEELLLRTRPRLRMGEHPVRRAFFGLALALMLGFLPAAYYARSAVRRELTALRVKQAEISSLPATQASLAHFDELDGQVHAVQLGGATRTLLIWILVAGVTGAVWTKLT
jgi:hypothetical protein